MKLTQRGNRFYLIKRVPDRFSSIEPRRQVWVSLKTDSKSEAKARAIEAIHDLEKQWAAKLNGKTKIVVVMMLCVPFLPRVASLTCQPIR
jgi:hypothetical protein